MRIDRENYWLYEPRRLRGAGNGAPEAPRGVRADAPLSAASVAAPTAATPASDPRAQIERLLAEHRQQLEQQREDLEVTLAEIAGGPSKAVK